MGGPLRGGRLRVGIVGAGKISGQYSETIAAHPSLVVAAVADLDTARAQALADRHDGARVLPLDELYAADLDVALNLTTPAGHAPIALAALAAGKHVYGEKPLALDTAQGRSVLAAARTAGLRVACAPDTVLSAGVQTARAAVDAGLIGVPHAATAFMTTPGHERWHPDPEFYYQPGGGPLLDMGPYYLTSLVHVLGPVRRVVALASRPRATRTIGAGPRAGTEFPVMIDTHTTGLLEHRSGALTTMIMSFDTWAAQLPRIEVYGADGSLSVPDPNRFDGDVAVYTGAVPEWRVVPPSAGYVGGGRGIGLVDLHDALTRVRPHRASAEVALHVLDVMESLQSAAVTGSAVEVTTTCERPAPFDRLIKG